MDRWVVEGLVDGFSVFAQVRSRVERGIRVGEPNDKDERGSE